MLWSLAPRSRSTNCRGDLCTLFALLPSSRNRPPGSDAFRMGKPRRTGRWHPGDAGDPTEVRWHSTYGLVRPSPQTGLHMTFDFSEVFTVAARLAVPLVLAKKLAFSFGCS